MWDKSPCWNSVAPISATTQGEPQQRVAGGRGKHVSSIPWDPAQVGAHWLGQVSLTLERKMIMKDSRHGHGCCEI